MIKPFYGYCSRDKESGLIDLVFADDLKEKEIMFSFYPAGRVVSHVAWLLASTKSFASLVNRVAGLFYSRRIKQTNYATYKPRDRSRKR